MIHQTKTEKLHIKKENNVNRPVSSNNDHNSKKRFVKPQLNEYPPLKNVTFLSVGGVSGGSVY
jgi:hypothetical protein